MTQQLAAESTGCSCSNCRMLADAEAIVGRNGRLHLQSDVQRNDLLLLSFEVSDEQVAWDYYSRRPE